MGAATLRHLRSGHSHEDVDQVFGSLALHIVRHARYCETPSDFAVAISQFCDGLHRPFERERAVVPFDAHRNWISGFALKFWQDFKGYLSCSLMIMDGA